MKAVILAGGSGQRLWPLSRKSYPKQFLAINSHKSLLQETLERALGHTRDILVVTPEEYFHQTRDHLEGMDLDGECIITEPQAKNTGPAIALVCAYLRERSYEDNVLVLPSDHVVSDDFFEVVKSARPLAKDRIVAFGIPPASPSPGYGYIRIGKPVGAGFHVEGFTEKPSPRLAEGFMGSGNYLWNSGIYLFRAPVMDEEFSTHLPEVHRHMTSYRDLAENYHRLPRISIDHAVMEKSSKVAVLPFKGTWLDVGSWEGIYQTLEKDARGNAFKGDILPLDTKNSLLYGGHRLIATMGLEDIVIIDTRDALLVAQRSMAEDARKMVETLKRQGRPEYRENSIVYRPWGYFMVLDNGTRSKVKRLCVYPGKGISHQIHRHRGEHWIVVRGRARVTRGGRTRDISENESIYVPKGTPHRLENPGSENLHVIETQTGDHLEEGDIVRVKDDFGR